MVAGPFQDLRQQRYVWIEPQLAVRAIAKPRAAGEQLRPAGIAERVGTGCPRENGAAADELVKVRRFDLRIAQCCNSIRPHVIGDEEQDVGRPVGGN